MGTGKMEKEGKNDSKHLDLLMHNILGHPQGAYKVRGAWLK